MVLRIDALQAVEGDVGVDLCRRNVGMSEDGLDGAQIGAILDHVGRARVAQHVRTSVASGGKTGFADQLPEALTGQAAASRAQKQKRRLLFPGQCFPAIFEVML